MKKLLSLLVLWTLTIQAATVGIVSGTGSQPVVSLGAGKTPLLTPIGGVDLSNNLVPLLVNADGSLVTTGGGGGGGAGDASASNQVIGNNYLNSIDGKTPALVGGRQPVDGSGVTQPVSGTFWHEMFHAMQFVLGMNNAISREMMEMLAENSATMVMNVLKK